MFSLEQETMLKNVYSNSMSKYYLGMEKLCTLLFVTSEMPTKKQNYFAFCFSEAKAEVIVFVHYTVGHTV